MNPYIIAKGDTLGALATKNNTTVGNLLNLNKNITNPNLILEGQKLNLGLAAPVGGNTTQNVIPPVTQQTTGISTNTGAPYIADSSGSVQQEKSLMEQLNSYSGTNEYETKMNDYKKQTDELFKLRESTLKAEGEREIQGIEQDFADLTGKTQDAQRKELASNVVSLARIGGYLGGSASAQGNLNNLQQTHRTELVQLDQKRQQALSIARSAQTEKQFKLAQSKLEEAKAIEKDISERKDKFFDQFLKLSSESRSQDKFITEKADEAISKFVDSGVEPSPEEVFSLAQTLKTEPQVIYSLITAKQESKALEQKKDKIDIDAKILTVLKDIPAGKYVKIGDQMYAGLKVKESSGGGDGVLPGQFSEAEKYVMANKDKLSTAEMNTYLRKNFNKLTDGDISSILKSGGAVENVTPFTPVQIESAAKILMESADNNPEQAKALVDSSTTLTAQKKQQLKDKIDEDSKSGPFMSGVKQTFNQMLGR